MAWRRRRVGLAGRRVRTRHGWLDHLIRAGVCHQRADARLASTLGFGPDALTRPDVTATAVMASPDQPTLDRLAAEAAADRLRVPVTRTYRLAEVPAALADFGAGTVGKLAVAID